MITAPLLSMFVIPVAYLLLRGRRKQNAECVQPVGIPTSPSSASH